MIDNEIISICYIITVSLDASSRYLVLFSIYCNTDANPTNEKKEVYQRKYSFFFVTSFNI